MRRFTHQTPRLKLRTAAGKKHLACRSGIRKGAGLASIASLSLVFAGSAQAANPPVNLGSSSSFSVLAGSTVTNTGPTTMFGDLGLDPGSAITGAPHALGATYVDDAVALSAKNSLVTAWTDAAGRPATVLASADLSGESFTPGVYDASSSLLFSAGDVTLNAEGNPERCVHLPGRQLVDDWLGDEGSPHEWGAAVQRLLGDRCIRDARNQLDVRRDRDGVDDDHRSDRRHARWETPRQKRRGEPGYEHDHHLGMRRRHRWR